MPKYGEGFYMIIREPGGWCVARQTSADGRWHRVSDVYRFRGWAQNFARRMRLRVVNYESKFA